MRDLDPMDLGVLLSVFAVLLLFFGVDFRISRGAGRRYRRRAVAFVSLSLLGEAATAIALVLTWVSLFLPAAAEHIDTLLVFVPGSIAIGCAVVLTVESVVSRLIALRTDAD